MSPTAWIDARYTSRPCISASGSLSSPIGRHAAGALADLLLHRRGGRLLALESGAEIGFAARVAGATGVVEALLARRGERVPLCLIGDHQSRLAARCSLCRPRPSRSLATTRAQCDRTREQRGRDPGPPSLHVFPPCAALPALGGGVVCTIEDRMGTLDPARSHAKRCESVSGGDSREKGTDLMDRAFPIPVHMVTRVRPRNDCAGIFAYQRSGLACDARGVHAVERRCLR